MDSFQKRNLTKNIFQCLANGGIFLSAFTTPDTPVSELIRIEDQRDIYRLRHALKRLATGGYITFHEHQSGEVEIIPTGKGQKAISRRELSRMRVEKPRRWDGFWRMVIFDVPETKKDARDAFRRELVRLGFWQFQRSVFLHPFPCENEIDFLRQFFAIPDVVQIFHVKTLDPDLEKTLREQFGI
ncbi:MAG: hypothetical protein HYW80_01815 [Parcubacteria group bacterium]|nr:hypothetical protein [Parcubacteria group bacterium]